MRAGPGSERCAIVTMSNTKTIAKNTGWYGLETVISSLVTIISSIAIARALGPTKTGFIIYISYVASVVGNFGGFGIPAATRKYMAEFIGGGDKGTARYIFSHTFRMQVALASVATAGILFWVLRDTNNQYHLASALIVLSIWPSMVNSIPAGANAASEDLAANAPASVVSAFVYLFAIAATVLFHWGVTGIGAALLLMRSVDFLVRLFPTMRHMRTWERGHSLPDGVRKRMISFAWQSIATMLLAMIVWERFEVLLLKSLCADIRQVAYYSIAFSMGNTLLLSASIFAGAAGTTIYAQYGRDKSRLPQLTAASFRYLVISTMPLHAVATALAFPALIFFYGGKYSDAAAVVTIAPLLCMPKAFVSPIQGLLESTEHQAYEIATMIVAGLVDVGVTWSLVASHGAVGACIGSGAAQITAVAIMWTIGIRLYRVKLPWVLTAKVAFLSAVAAYCAHLFTARLRPLPGILAGGAAAAIVIAALFYALRVLEPEDHKRFAILTKMLPQPASGLCDRFLTLLIRPRPDGKIETEKMDARV